MESRVSASVKPVQLWDASQFSVHSISKSLRPIPTPSSLMWISAIGRGKALLTIWGSYLTLRQNREHTLYGIPPPKTLQRN